MPTNNQLEVKSAKAKLSKKIIIAAFVSLLSHMERCIKASLFVLRYAAIQPKQR